MPSQTKGRIICLVAKPSRGCMEHSATTISGCKPVPHDFVGQTTSPTSPFSQQQLLLQFVDKTPSSGAAILANLAAIVVNVVVILRIAV